MVLVLLEQFVLVLGIYLAVGLLFAVPFVIVGVHRIDAAAEDAGVLFRVIILPGVAMLWPLLLTRWIRRPNAAAALAGPQGREEGS